MVNFNLVMMIEQYVNQDKMEQEQYLEPINLTMENMNGQLKWMIHKLILNVQEYVIKKLIKHQVLAIKMRGAYKQILIHISFNLLMEWVNYIKIKL